MKILITGGAGFIGSNMIRHLLSTYKDYSVVNLDKLTYAGNLKNLTDIERKYPDRYRFVHGDIAREKNIESAGSDIDVIINFAAESHVDRSIAGPEAFLSTDIMGTYRLLEYIRRRNIKRYIQISTDEVFGALPEGEAEEESRFDPSSPYSASKASGDLLCNAYMRTYGLPIIVIHSCNVYGPFQYPEKIIPLFITNLIDGKKVPVYGDGLQSREWIFVEDFARALDTVLHKGSDREVYNIGTRERLTNLELTKKILHSMAKDDSWIQPVADRPGHDVRYAVNPAKIQALGWKHTVSFEEGLARTVAWYQENRAWWEHIKNGAFWEFYKNNYKPL